MFLAFVQLQFCLHIVLKSTSNRSVDRPALPGEYKADSKTVSLLEMLLHHIQAVELLATMLKEALPGIWDWVCLVRAETEVVVRLIVLRFLHSLLRVSGHVGWRSD